MDANIVCKRCGSSDYRTERAGPHIKAVCNNCNQYIKFLPQGREEPTLYFPKYKGRTVKSMKLVEEINYLCWIIAKIPNIKPSLKEAIIEQIKKHQNP